MPDRINCLKDFLWTFTSAFWDGDFDTVADMHTLPQVIYTKLGAHICRNREELISHLGEYRRVLDARGTTQLTPKIKATENLTPIRARITIEWLSDTEEEDTTVVYYFVLSDERWKIEMSRVDFSVMSPDTIRQILKTKENNEA